MMGNGMGDTFSDSVRLGSGGFTYEVPTSFPHTVLTRYSLRHHKLITPPLLAVRPLHIHGVSPSLGLTNTRRRLSPSRTQSLNGNSSDRPHSLFISFSVPSKPIPQPRARVRYSQVRTWGYTPNRKRLLMYKKLIALSYKQAAQQKGLVGPQPFFGMAITLYFKKAARGDIDNYTKTILDALQGVAYPNDRYIKSLQVSLLEYASQEGAFISLW